MEKIKPLNAELLNLQDDSQSLERCWMDAISEISESTLVNSFNELGLEMNDNLAFSQENSQASMANSREKVAKSITNLKSSAKRTFSSANKTLEQLKPRVNHTRQLLEMARQRQSHADDSVSLKKLNEIHYKGQFTPRAIAEGLEVTADTYQLAGERYVKRATEIQKIVATLDRRAVGMIRNRDDKQIRDELEPLLKRTVQGVTTQLKRTASQFKEINPVELSGGQLIQSVQNPDDDLKIVVVGADEDREIPRSDTLQTPKVQDLQRIVEACDQLLKVIERQQPLNQQGVEQLEQTLDHSKELIGKMGESKSLDRMISTRDFKFVHNQIRGQTIVQLARVHRHMLKTVKSAVEHVESGVKAYGISPL